MIQNGKKLIALDLDGTLLTRDKRISTRNKRALLRAMEDGHHVVIATGRSVRGSLPYYEELALQTPMVNFNGAYVHHVRDRAWGEHHFPLDLAAALAVADACEGFDIENILAEVRDDYYMKRRDEELISFIGAGHEPSGVGRLHDVLPDHPTSILIRPNEMRIGELRDHLHAHHADVVEHRLWGAPWNVIEVVRAGVNKATGLELIAQRLGLGREDVIAFGDEDNDYEMIQYAGLGVAMANANPDLLAIADHVAPSNDDDGIAAVLEQVL